MEAVYVTRDSGRDWAEVYPATVGIRKFHGCVVYGAAWNKKFPDCSLYPQKHKLSESLNITDCRKRFGFYPRAGTAWYINTRGKRSKVDIDFSD